jgi:amidohydrolase
MIMSNMERISKIVDALSPELKKLTKDIHDNPELGNQEFKACGWQIALLTKYGFKIEENFCGLPTAYKATYKSGKPGPKIAMLAEYDALPEIGHGCGHNLIAMISVGSGIALKNLAEDLGGEIYVIGTPAEETIGAKIQMADQGVFDEMDVAMMAHPAYLDVDSVDTMAVEPYRFEFIGRPSHAAGSPEDGLNALDAVINLFNMINALRQQTKPDARIHGIIIDGGKTPNIIPDHGEAAFYIRANRTGYLKELTEKVMDCARGAALGTGTELKISRYEVAFKDLCSNRTLSELCVNQVEKLGIQVNRFGLGGMTVPGSSDLGDVSYKCPAIELGCKIGDPANGNVLSSHTVDFAEKAGSEAAINTGLTYVKAFAMTGEELMTNPEHLKAIKEEFSRINERNTIF